MIDFVIAGTFKAASSTLSYELAKHSEVFVPKPKDPHYYVGGFFRSLEGPEEFLKHQHSHATYARAEFEALYEPVGKALKCDATPLYLYCHEQAIPAIQADNPDAKIVIILRNPADRAFSNFNHNVKDGFENRSFSSCIDQWEETERFPMHPFFHYVRAGFYDAQVAAYLAAFEHVKVVTYDQVVTDIHLVLNEIAEFLGINPEFKPRSDAIQLNKSGLPRFPALHRFILQENPIKNALRPLYRSVLRNPYTRKRVAERVKNFNIESQQMAPAERARLYALYSSDIERVSERVGMDLARRWGI
ncbi:sulfotransferase [Qipengyuania sp.]|uniref:sulfotransferase n=1 Tax=Qipengyuania sp. TaxID=2004515 RepID=UPI00351209E5